MICHICKRRLKTANARRDHTAWCKRQHPIDRLNRRYRNDPKRLNRVLLIREMEIGYKLWLVGGNKENA